MRSSRRARRVATGPWVPTGAPPDGRRIAGPHLEGPLDDSLRAVAGLLGAATGGRVVSLWLVGSYHEGAPVRTSAIDLVAALGPGSTVGTADAVRDTVARIATLARVPPRVEVVAAETLVAEGHVHVALASTPVEGPLTTATVPVPEAPRPYRQAVRRAVRLARAVRGGARPLDVPGPPDPRAELLGYDRTRVRDPMDGRPARSLRAAVDLAGWLAAAIALAADPHPVAGRTEAVERLRTLATIDDALAPAASVVAETVKVVREQHAYLVPTAARARRRVAALLDDLAQTERALFGRLRERLLEDLRSVWPDDRLFALEALHALGGFDGRVVRMLEAATLDPEPTVAARAAQVVAAAT